MLTSSTHVYHATTTSRVPLCVDPGQAVARIYMDFSVGVSGWALESGGIVVAKMDSTTLHTQAVLALESMVMPAGCESRVFRDLSLVIPCANTAIVTVTYDSARVAAEPTGAGETEDDYDGRP